MDDERNTDTAWVSAKIEWFHDDENLFDAFDFVDVKTEGQVCEVAWITVHRGVDLFGEQEFVLEKVANKQQAYW